MEEDKKKKGKHVKKRKIYLEVFLCTFYTHSIDVIDINIIVLLFF